MDYPFHSAPRGAVRLLVQKKEEEFFHSLGSQRHLAVGAPYIYVPSPRLDRRPGTLIAMPSHSFAGGAHQALGATREYAAYLVTLRTTYPFIAVCLYGDDYLDLETRQQYQAAGLPVIRGSSIRDANSLPRMRALFEFFDCVTSNDIGSHAIYASATGCRVFLSDHTLFPEREATWSRHSFYQKRPNVMRNVLRWINPAWLRGQWPWLYQGPQDPCANVEWANEFLGTENKRSFQEMARLFGWRYPFSGEESQEEFLRQAPLFGWSAPGESAPAKAGRQKNSKDEQQLKQISSSLTWKLARPLFRLERSLRKRLNHPSL